MDEVVIVNEKDEVMGTMLRAEAEKNGTPHRIAVTYLENKENKILVQVRMSGSLDHSSAGHVDPGETYLETATRELEEELGVSNATLISIGKGFSDEIRQDVGEHRVHFFEVFVCNAKPGVLNTEEVKDVYWANPEDILREMTNNLEDNKFTGGFRVSLPIYLKYRKEV